MLNLGGNLGSTTFLVLSKGPDILNIGILQLKLISGGNVFELRIISYDNLSIDQIASSVSFNAQGSQFYISLLDFCPRLSQEIGQLPRMISCALLVYDAIPLPRTRIP